MSNISFNLTLGQIFMILLCTAAFIVLIYIIVLLKKTLPVIDKLNKILEDTSVVSEALAEGTTAAKESITEISATIKDVSGTLNTNKNIISFITTLISSFSKIKRNIKTK